MQPKSPSESFEQLMQTDRDHIWHPFTSLVGMSPIPVESAKGVYLFTPDGRKIIDAVSSWWVNIHGHSHPRIANAIYEQANTLEHVIFAGFTHKPAIKLTQRLLSVLPENQKRIFFSDNGSTAVEVALKMAMQFWFNKQKPRKKVIALEGAYHGDTFGSMSVGERGDFTRPFHPFLFEVEYIPVPDAENIDAVATRLTELVSTNEVAAFIFEPLVQAAAGMVMYPAEYLDTLLRVAKDHGVICIADEVFTGFGRTGTLFATQQLSVLPDIMALSKGITGGTLPLGVTTCSEKIEDAFMSSERSHTFYHGHSYTANPIACAAACESFDLLMAFECREAIEQIGIQQQKFAEQISNHPMIRDARACGTILALELETSGRTSYFNQLRNTIYNYFLERDILLRPLGNVIYTLPPYVITSAELDSVHRAIQGFLEFLQTGDGATEET